MSPVKYNPKISNCNILTYINIGPGWESDRRGRQTLSCFWSRNLSSSIFYDVKCADCPQILFILQIVVVLITLHFTVLGLLITSQLLVLFSYQW